MPDQSAKSAPDGSVPAAPILSIVIPYFKRFDGLIGAVRSALALEADLGARDILSSGLEVITVNDGSGTEPDWPADLTAPQIRHLSLAQNSGACVARNTGLAQARGRYVIFLDSDDELIGDGVAACLALLDQRPDLAGAGGGLMLVDDIPGHPMIGTRAVPRQTDFSNGNVHFALNPIGPLSKMVFRREAVERIDGFDDALVACQDWDLYVELADQGPLALVPEPAATYLVSANSITGNLQKGLAGRQALMAKNAARPVWWHAVFLANALAFFARRKRLGLAFALIGALKPWPRRIGALVLLVPAIVYFLAQKVSR